MNEEFNQNELEDINSYRKQVGLLGFQNFEQQSTAPDREHDPDYGLDLYAMHLDEMEKLDDMGDTSDEQLGVLTGLVDRMRESVFKVRLMNSMSDIIMPLKEQFEIMQLEERLQFAQQHTESLTYYRSMINAIERLGRDDGPMAGMFRTMIMEYRRFTRSPVWTSLRLLTTRLIIPLVRTVSGVLFGGKKAKSDTDRIVEVLEKQLEFMRTGQIDQSQGFFERLSSQGILGMPARAFGRMIGRQFDVSAETAQDRENRSNRGEGNKGLLANPEGWLSSKLFGDEIKLGGIQGHQDDTKHNELIQTIKALPIRIAEQMFGVMQGSSPAMEKDLYRQAEMIGQSVGANLALPLNTQNDLLREILGKPQEVMMMADSEVGEKIINNATQTQRHYTMYDNFKKEETERANTIAENLENLNDYNKKQLKEQKKTNRSMMMTRLLQVVGIISTGVLAISTGIGSLVAGLLGGAGIGRMFGGKNVGVGGIGRGLKIGGGLGLAGLGINALTDRYTERGSTANKVGSNLGTAATWGGTGAMIGSVIPGIGTAIGGASGAIAGLIYENKDLVLDMFSTATEKAINVGKKIGDWFTNTENKPKDLFDKTLVWSDKINNNIEDWFGEGTAGNMAKFVLNPLSRVQSIVDKVSSFMGMNEEREPLGLDNINAIVQRNIVNDARVDNSPMESNGIDRSIRERFNYPSSNMSSIDLSPLQSAIEKSNKDVVNKTNEELTLLNTIREVLGTIATNTKEKSKEAKPVEQFRMGNDDNTAFNVIGG